MATNIIYDRIFKGLILILGKNTVVADDLGKTSSEYTRLSLESSPEMIENTGPTVSMRYSINIDIITNRAKRSKYITQAVSNILSKLNANPAYNAGGVYYWHDGQIIPGEYGEGEDYASRIVWQATHTEAK